MFTETRVSEQQCYYCAGEVANSRPFKLELLRLKEIKVRSDGFRQHTANYINKSAVILVPRSQKAFIVHSVNSFLKLGSLLACLIALNTSSILWRILIGIVVGAMLSKLTLKLFRTKSNVTYLFTYSTVLRMLIWLLIIVLLSKFSLYPFNITTSDYIYFAVVCILLFDSFFMSLINLLLGKYASKPMAEQYPEIKRKFEEGFKVNNDVIIISVVYPCIKWIFG
ncbi:MAG: hypothetical protein HC906_04210 [Bacteroidales bacterium]|nr:hypothetical protein [Bacteroidales bacterium]